MERGLEVFSAAAVVLLLALVPLPGYPAILVTEALPEPSMPLFMDPNAKLDYIAKSEREPDTVENGVTKPGAPKPGATTFELGIYTPRQAAELADLRMQEEFPVGSYVLLAVRYGVKGWRTPGQPRVAAHPRTGLSDEQIALMPYSLRVELEGALDKFQVAQVDDLGKSS